MYRDWNYFLREAEKIVDQQGVRYTRSTSGYDKGTYTAKLDLKGVSYEEQPQYLIQNYGSNIPYYARHSSHDKDIAKRFLTNAIASHLSDVNDDTNLQKVSERWIYYKYLPSEDKQDIYLSSRIGRNLFDFFRLLEGEINEENWRTVQKNAKESVVIGTVTNFKEFFYKLKERAAAEFLNNNSSGHDDVGNRRNARNTFIFDVNEIPEAVEMEAKLNPTEVKIEEPKKEQAQNTDTEEIKNIALSNIPNDGFSKVGYRPEFLNGAVLVGREREIIFPNNEIHKAYFAIVELHDLLASHNEQTFSSTENYPVDENGRNINDRNYAGDKNAQAKVKTVAQKLNPNIIISTSATASGTPVISIDGVVVSGNNRTMSLKLAATEEYKEHFEKYQQTLFEELSAGGYGFENITATQLRLKDSIALPGSSFHSPKSLKFKNPILVRIDVDFPAYNTSELNKFNKSRSKSEKNIDAAIRISRQLQESSNERCKTSLIDLVSEQEVVSELYNSRDAVNRFKKILLDCNIISENEISGNFTDVSLTENGKILFDTLLLSLVLNAKAIEVSQNDGVKSATRSIVNGIIPLIKNSKLGDFSLIEEINNALLIQNSMISHGYKNLNEYITQMTMFNDDDIFKTDKAFVLNSFMNDKVNSLKTALLRYNNSAESNSGAGLFGDNLTPGQVFSSIFEKEADPMVIKALLIKNGHTTTPQNEASQQEITPIIEGEEIVGLPINTLSNENGDEEKNESISDAPKPIRQLGPGGNVYFETKNGKFRVNDYKDKVLLIAYGNKKEDVFPIANYTFDTAKEAVAVASELAKICPEGIPPALLIDKVVDGIKRELAGQPEHFDGTEKATKEVIDPIEIVEPEPPVQAPVESESPKESLQLRIARLQKTLKYQNEQDKPQVEQLINRLTKALKYL
jgi:hypothetical protein